MSELKPGLFYQVPVKTTFQQELEHLINRHSQENGSDTPDFILAGYLTDCLEAWNRATQHREKWYGRAPKPVETPPATS